MTGLLIALIVVATNLGVDALATTALALAVIAFSAQLIVYVAQVSDSAETRRQSLQVNAATQASLARIGSTVAASDQLLRDQHSQVLGPIVEVFRQAALASKKDESRLDFADAVDMLESRASAPGDVGELAGHGYRPPESLGSHTRVNELELWPEESEMDEARKAYLLLSDLDPISVAQVVRFAEDEKFSESLEMDPGLIYRGPTRSPFTDALLNAGLVEKTGDFPVGRSATDLHSEYVVLTALGKMAARLLFPKGPAPLRIRELAQR
ncbi:hypothetical protein [Arthrobacter yangruifuii]|uniref:hypothetical protein n=1 Tax=Arthrobacter yangruifuii TaxID=2606616 RepID=UPI0011B4232B|nr:hypothetical protein [Arthrobacter yangruifuii]